MLLILCAIVFLWFRLIDHLRVEWSVNPQYGFGWAVPFLCLYLIWEKLKTETLKAESRAEDKGQKAEGEGQRTNGPLSSLLYLLLALCALAYAPTRLIQEANPEWRLVSWALALEVIGMTLLLLRVSRITCHVSRFTFPVCFFLVAVPWVLLR